MSTPVEQFIRETHKRFNVKYALTGETLRRIRTKLRLADIVHEVTAADEAVATDIVLKDYGMGSSNMKTANTSAMQPNGLRVGGGCPRCGHHMESVRLAGKEDARYCTNCRVCVPV